MRYNKPIKGSMSQMSFIQGLVSNVKGVSAPVLYLQGMLFPKHFWSSASKDRTAILGCAPVSCYRGDRTHPDGFAS
jgi:hypothetical protein